MKARYSTVRYTQRNVIGRTALVRYDGKLAGARVMDRVAGTNRAKRVQLNTGEDTGKVLAPGAYEVVEFCDPHEVPEFLRTAWGELCEA